MELSEFWDFALTAEQVYADYRKQIMEKFSLTAAETDIIMFLANNPGFDTAAQIAKIRKIPKSQISVSVNSLTERSLLTGCYHHGNKKSIHLKLTESAMPIITYGHQVQAAFGKRLFKDFSPKETAEFQRLQRKIANNIQKKGL